jgi:flagellar hook-associated protein 2
MSGISSGVGLVSGINYASLINSLLAIDEQPQEVVQSQIENAQAQNSAYTTLSTQLSGIQSIGNDLSLPETFQAATTSSSDPNVLTATAAEGAAVGSYQFQVAQLVTTQQSITDGFASATNSPVGAGTLTIEEGNGQASSQTLLSQLNGGQGVQRGEFRITDRSGNSAVINISDAVSLDDVVNDINSADNISVKASLTNSGIVLTDTSGGTSNSLTVQDLGGGSAAADLGIAGNSDGTNVLTGTDINTIGSETQLGSLNDGRGINAVSSTGISSSTLLSSLNGNTGIGAAASGNDFKVNLSSGTSFNVSLNTTSTVSGVTTTTPITTLGGVVSAINAAGNGKVTASIAPGNQGLEIIDNSGGTGTFSISAISGSSAAAGLGILGTGSGGTIVGSSLTNPDFQVNLSDGSSFDVTVGSAQTLGQVISEINTAGAGKILASVASNGQSISLHDLSGGSGTFSVTALNGSDAAADLGIAGTGTSGVIAGSDVQAGLNSVLVSSLNGGNGIPLGEIQITNRNGVSSGSINLAGAQSLSDILNDINTQAAGIDVTASLNAAGTGIQLTDASGGTGSLSVADLTSTTASALGIAGTFDSSTVVGSNLQRQYISDNTQLSQLNGGQGVELGSFSITNSAGARTTIDLTQGTYNTVGDVINAINSADAGVKASINSTGNGILLTDKADGAGKLTVADIDGTSAADLNIAGTATGTTINGAFEKTITVTAADTLTTVQNKINSLGFGVTAQIVNDGSSTNPYRLSLTSLNSGAAGTVIIDGGTTDLNPTTLVQGQDAAVFLGGSGGSSQPLLVTSSTNQLTNVINGVTINLNSASSSPVTLNVSLDPTQVESDLANFVQQFNTLVSEIGTYTTFNTNTNQGALLLGDQTTQEIQSILYNVVNNSNVKGAGQYQSLADIGITVNDNAQLSFDTNAFSAAFASDPTGVQTLFSQTTLGANNTSTGTGLGYLISNAVTQLTDPVTGIITLKEGSVNTQIQNYTTYYNELNQQVQNQRTLLETQFANLETNLASLQSQQEVLNAFSSAAAASAASDASSASSTPAASSSSSNSSSNSSSGS